MNLFTQLRDDLLAAIGLLQAAGELPAELDLDRVVVEPPRDPGHGDAATNAALVLAKQARRAPMALADVLVQRLDELPGVASVAVAKPGFINFRLQSARWQAQVPLVLRAGRDYGVTDLGRGKPVNVEFCSANPTGPLHVGHGRGTMFGDALANLLERTGFAVTREYYINDSGEQIARLARSVHYRYLQALGRAPAAEPTDWYPTAELIEVGKTIAAADGTKWVEAPEEVWSPVFRERAVAAMLERVKSDLAALGVRHDVFTSERELTRKGRIESALAQLEQDGLIYTGTLPPPKGKAIEDYEPVPLLLFRSIRFGDDSDRPIRNSKGQWTYFAADLAYHLDKVERGARELIDVLGADHGGYVKRMKAGVTALSRGQAELDVKLCQMVNLMDAGQPLKMSKRAGRIVNLRDVIDEVGKDVFRFIMLTRKNDAPLDFDFQKVTEQSRDNPVFYVQYAHARICSVQRHAGEAGWSCAAADLAGADAGLLADPGELDLIKLMAGWPRILESAALHHEPHRIPHYLYDLAAAFHALWNQGKERSELRFLRPDQPALTRARLAMLGAVQTVIASGLGLIGVDPVEEML